MTAYSGQILNQTLLGQLCSALWDSQSQPVGIQPGIKPRSVVTPLALTCSALDRCTTQEPQFFFLLMAYDGIFNETDTLFHVLQNKVMDLGVCRTLSDTMKALERQRQDFDRFYERVKQKCNELGLAKSETHSKQPIRVERGRIYYNMQDNINVQM